MSERTILFIQGGGKGAYEADKEIALHFEKALGGTHKIVYPPMPNEEDPDYEPYKSKIEEALMKINGDLILVGHSLGGSVLLKYLTEENIGKNIRGLFLLSAPFWGPGGWEYEGFSLNDELIGNKTAGIPMFFYQGTADEVVPLSHLAIYKKKFPHANCQEIINGGHQLENNLSGIILDIKNIA